MKKLIFTLTFALGAVTAFACTNFIVTKGASTDGSVMVTYAADSHQLYGALYFTPKGNFKPGAMLRVDEWDTGKYLGDIAQIPQTYTTIGNMPRLFGHLGLDSSLLWEAVLFIDES